MAYARSDANARSSSNSSLLRLPASVFSQEGATAQDLRTTAQAVGSPAVDLPCEPHGRTPRAMKKRGDSPRVFYCRMASCAANPVSGTNGTVRLGSERMPIRCCQSGARHLCDTRFGMLANLVHTPGARHLLRPARMLANQEPQPGARHLCDPRVGMLANLVHTSGANPVPGTS